MKYLLIDGNNLAVRSAFANSELKSSDGTYTGAIYGTFNSLLNLRKHFPDHRFLISWDSKSQRRMEETLSAKASGIIPEVYKENRKKDEMPLPLQAFYANSDFLKKGIGELGIAQIQLNGHESDDILGSYAEALKKDPANEIVLVTSDRDYYQLLDSNVWIWDGMKADNKKITKETLFETKKITPEDCIHIGALMGDDGDNIFGVPGCGEKTAFEKIKNHKTYQEVLSNVKKTLDKIRQDFPDLNTLEDGNVKFNELKEAKTEKARAKWPEITFDMPYTGVAWALEFKKTKEKLSKNDIQIAMFERRIHLAYSLKKIDTDIAELVEINEGEVNVENVDEFLKYFEIYSIHGGMFQTGYIPKEESLFVDL